MLSLQYGIIYPERNGYLNKEAHIMDRNERVMEILRQMISIHSETGTNGELEIEKYLHY